jgi:hypothetical protein
MRYIFGPLPKAICHFSVFVKFYLTTHGIVLLDMIMVSRYIFIFWLKNPAAFYDEFWSYFLNCWTFVFTFFTQLLLTLLPGKDFPDIWICTGTDPNEDVQTEYKSVRGNNVFKVFSIILHIVIPLRIKIYKWKLSQENASYHPRSKIAWLFSLDSNSALDTAESIIPLALMGMAVLLNTPRKRLSLETLNNYPDCLQEYFYTFIRPTLMVLLAASSKFIGNRNLRKFWAKELRSFYESVFH